MKVFADTELILSPEGRVYHLQLLDRDIADTVLLVGDPGRVSHISSKFDQIDFSVTNREFICHTGVFRNKRLTVLSTGIGTDNIDIVINELDAAVNIDPVTRTEKAEKRILNLIRLGTCGTIQADISVDEIVCSSFGIGFDGLLNFYARSLPFCEEEISMAFVKQSTWPHRLPYPYCVAADSKLLSNFSDCISGITATAPGFYGPQGRELRLMPEIEGLNETLAAFRFQDKRIINFEMETSALYGLGKMLGHRCLTLCVVIANRSTRRFSGDHHQSVNKLIDYSLNKISQFI